MKRKYDISNFVNVDTIQSIQDDLSVRFKRRRKESGLSQKSLAVKSGVSYGSIRRFESSGEISLSNLLRISHALNLLSEFKMLFKQPIVKDIRQ